MDSQAAQQISLILLNWLKQTNRTAVELPLKAGRAASRAQPLMCICSAFVTHPLCAQWNGKLDSSLHPALIVF